MGYTYATYQSALALEMAIPNANVNDPNFVAILPTIIDYAEQRLYRELDLLYATTAQVVTPPLTALNRSFSLSATVPNIIILEDINIITPAGVTNPNTAGATRNQCMPCAKEWLDAAWPSSAGAGVPNLFAMLDNQTVLLGPWPLAAYSVEAVGKFRPLAIYDPTQASGTFLSLELPDIFLAASMIAASGYQKSFGQQSDNPQMAVSWETQYQALFPSASAEETRKKFRGFQGNTSTHMPMQGA